MKAESCQVRLDLEKEPILKKQFLVVKKYYVLKNNTEVVRRLINEQYKQLLPSEARKAEADGSN